MRRRLDRTRAIAGVEHLAEDPLEVDRLGRRPVELPPLAADARLDGADEPRSPAGGGEDRVEEEGGGRLAARPGHPGDLELRGRVAEERDRRPGHRGARVRDHELRDVEVEAPLDHERDGAVLDRLRREVVPVRTRSGDAEEDRAGTGAPRVVDEIRHLRGGSTDDLDRSERGGQPLQIHRG